MNVNDANRPKNSKQPKSAPKQKFHDQNRQWNYSPMTMPFQSHSSYMPMPCGSYYNMHYYFYPSWSFNSYMPFSPRYFCSDYITYKESVIKKSPFVNYDRFNHKNQSVQKKT